ncbi:MAG: sugar ABC transporter permease [Capsulimonas sp.]|uniref:carbohydrate ABC transporter permease n=1 Tax=Capsulimonas sp. TaxID=2494211 RepID=UPI003263FFE1
MSATINPAPSKAPPDAKTPSRTTIHRPKASWFSAQYKLAPYVFVSPFILLFAIFGVYPIVKSILLAFYATNGPKNQVFVGLSNFHYMFHDPDFWTAVTNTGTFALWSVFLQLPLSLGLALLLNQKWLRGQNFLRLAFFSPNLLGQVFVGVLFSQLFMVHYGLVNRILNALAPGVFSLDTKWLSDPTYVMPAIVLTSLWLYCGFNMIYFLAGLQAVDRELYEAALVDGAGPWRQFLHITLPGIKPIAVFVLVTSTIGSFQLFELPYLLLGGAGPKNSGLTVVMYLYQNGFQTGDLGYASAVGWTLAIGVLFISLIQMRITGAWKGTKG